MDNKNKFYAIQKYTNDWFNQEQLWKLELHLPPQ